MENIINCPFWERTKKLIKIFKLTQEKLAVKIDVPYGTLKNWICYGLIPDAVTACDIAGVFGVTVEYLVFGKQRRPKINTKNEAKIRKTTASVIGKIALQTKKMP